MNQRWIGRPLEPYGFSRDAELWLSKPSFDSVSFTLGADSIELIVNLQNSES
jgi:uncharacterized protein (DUF2141 family)